MELDETQALVVYTLLEGVELAIKNGSEDDAKKLAWAAKCVMTTMAVEDISKWACSQKDS